jgi:hypothetical protein
VSGPTDRVDAKDAPPCPYLALLHPTGPDTKTFQAIAAAKRGTAPTADAGHAKAFATAQARAALRALELVHLADGTFLAAKPAWGMHTILPNLDAVEAWLKKVGA